MNASLAETRQLVERKLAEEYEPKNVQVDVINVKLGVVMIKL